MILFFLLELQQLTAVSPITNAIIKMTAVLGPVVSNQVSRILLLIATNTDSVQSNYGDSIHTRQPFACHLKLSQLGAVIENSPTRTLAINLIITQKN